MAHTTAVDVWSAGATLIQVLMGRAFLRVARTVSPEFHAMVGGSVFPWPRSREATGSRHLPRSTSINRGMRVSDLGSAFADDRRNVVRASSTPPEGMQKCSIHGADSARVPDFIDGSRRDFSCTAPSDRSSRLVAGCHWKPCGCNTRSLRELLRSRPSVLEASRTSVQHACTVHALEFTSHSFHTVNASSTTTQHHTNTHNHTRRHTHTTNTRRQRQKKKSEKEDRERRQREREEKTKDKTRQDKTRQDKTRQDKTRQDKTRQDKTRQDKTRQDKTRQDKTRQDKTRQDKTRQDKTRQDKTRQDKTRQDKTRQDKTRQDKTRQDKTRQDKTRQDKTRQDKTRQDKTRQDKTRQDKTRQDKMKGF